MDLYCKNCGHSMTSHNGEGKCQHKGHSSSWCQCLEYQPREPAQHFGPDGGSILFDRKTEKVAGLESHLWVVRDFGDYWLECREGDGQVYSYKFTREELRDMAHGILAATGDAPEGRART